MSRAKHHKFIIRHIKRQRYPILEPLGEWELGEIRELLHGMYNYLVEANFRNMFNDKELLK